MPISQVLVKEIIKFLPVPIWSAAVSPVKTRLGSQCLPKPSSVALIPERRDAHRNAARPHWKVPRQRKRVAHHGREEPFSQEAK